MQECGFVDEISNEMPLGDEIVVCDENCDDEFLISNSRKLKAQVYAPEINFYLKNSKDDALSKAKAVSALYQARLIGFDESKQSEHEKAVGRNVLIISDDDKSALKELLEQNSFKVISLLKSEVLAIYGGVGDLAVVIKQNSEEYELECDFALINNASPDMLVQSGSFEINSLSDDEILAFLRANTPKYAYKTRFFYDESICQYHQRRNEICGACANTCPSVAILKNDEQKELVFNQIDCLGCALCVSVCPSGSLSLASMPKSAFSQIAKLYKDNIILAINESLLDYEPKTIPDTRPFWQENEQISPFKQASVYSLAKRPKKLDLSNLSLPSDVLPLALNTKMLDHASYLTLAQSSGAQIVVYQPNISAINLSNIKLVNEIYQKLYGKDAVLVATNENELVNKLKQACKIEGSQLIKDDYDMPKREIFATRLAAVLDGRDLGVVQGDEILRYADVVINEDACTLCSSCVAACNVNALIADTSDNSIKFNASLCTACGYCVASCAEEGAIDIKRGALKLNPSFFSYQSLAHDELFKCQECGKEFATKKSIEKIAKIMAVHFANDPIKLKSLYCCAECKAKLMLKAQIME